MSEMELSAFLEKVEWDKIEPREVAGQLKFAIIKDYVSGQFNSTQIAKKHAVDLRSVVQPIVLGYHRYVAGLDKAVEALQAEPDEEKSQVIMAFNEALNRFLPEPKQKPIVSRDGILSVRMGRYKISRDTLKKYLEHNGKNADVTALALMRAAIKDADELYSEMLEWLRYV